MNRMSPASVMVVRELVKEYRIDRRKFVKAVDGISFEVRRGETLALVGPNGAGKTTTLKIIAGILAPTSGRSEMAGIGTEAGAKIGYLPEIPALYPFLTGRQHLEYFLRLLTPGRNGSAGAAAGSAGGRIESFLDRVGLADAACRRADGYSRGMRVRLGLAIALLRDPELLLLDEPFSGIDPLGRIQIRDLLKELRAEGKSILISTHDLDEAGRLSDRIGLMVEGRMRRIGSPTDVAGRGTLEEAFLAEAMPSAASSRPTARS